MTIKVELDVFSGRPNPSWILSPEESQALLKELSALPAADAKAHLGDDGLGYRGIILTIQPDSKTILNGISSFRINEGLVSSNDSSSVASFTDIHQIERRLLDQAKQKGFKELVETLEK